MRHITSALVMAAVVLCCTTPVRAAARADHAAVAARIAKQNQLFDELYQDFLKRHPTLATAFGDYRYNDQLDDGSLQALAAENRSNQQILTRLRSIPTAGFPEQDLLSHQVAEWKLQQDLADYRFKVQEMPISQMQGPHLRLADLPLSVPLDSVKHYEDYIARLQQIPRLLKQTEAVLRAGRQDRLMPVRFLLDKVPAQCQGVINDDPFLAPTGKYPQSIAADERERLTKTITDVVNTEVLPAYAEFSRFVATDYAPFGRTKLAISSLPGGIARYRNNIRSYTSVSDLTPAQIHQIGLKEIERIQGEMAQLAQAQGYPDLDAYRQALHSDPKYRAASAQQIVDDFRRYIEQMRAKLPELFGYIPDSPITVEPMPAFQSADATHYVTGTPDGSRPGRVVVAVSDAPERSLLDDEATAYHEGIPGHHMQQSVAQQMQGLPGFRQHVWNSGYGEGWALYSERLGKEVGFYQEPASDWGRLTSELFRAVRLVVDTGIHSQGWSREQVVAFFRQYQPVDEPTIQSETDRYIAWPGQALSYKLGELKFRELRERARGQLGARFDIRHFHDEMLSGGVLPLSLLQARTDRWIAAGGP